MSGVARPASRKGRVHDADQTLGLGATSPRATAHHSAAPTAHAGRHSPHVAASQIPLAKSGLSAATVALANAAHIHGPHGTLLAAAHPTSSQKATRPPSAVRAPRDRYADATHSNGGSPNGVRRPSRSPQRARGQSDNEFSELEVSTWREGEVEVEDEHTVRRLTSFVTELAQTPDAPQGTRDTPISTDEGSAGIDSAANMVGGGASLPTPPLGPPERSSQTLLGVYPEASPVSCVPNVPTASPMRPAGRTLPEALPKLELSGVRHEGNHITRITTPDSPALPSPWPAVATAMPTEVPDRNGPSAMSPVVPSPPVDALAESNRPKSHRSPTRSSPTRRHRRRSISPGPATRELARKLSQTLVTQLSTLPLQDDLEHPSAQPPELENTPAASMSGESNGESNGESSGGEYSDEVVLGAEAVDPNYHEVFGDLRDVPAQVNSSFILFFGLFSLS